MDSLRENASQHAGNLRAELMQTTGNTQLFTNQFVGDLLSGLSGGAPSLDAIEKAVGTVIARHESRQQQISQSGMSDTLAASQSAGTGQRSMANSPMSMQMNNMMATATGATQSTPNMMDAGANAGVQNPMDQSGAAVGQQGASWVSNAFKKLRTGALVLGLASAAMTGFLGYNHMTNTPDMPAPTPIELIQEQQAPTQGGVEIVTPAPVQQDGAFGPGAGQIENDKEQAHQEYLQGSGQDSSGVVAPQAPASPPDAAPTPATPNDKDAAHEAIYGAAGDSGGGGGGSVSEAPAQSGAADEGVVTGSDEGVRSFVGGSGGGQDLGPQDTSRND